MIAVPRVMTVTWRDMPPEVRRIMEPLVEKWSHLVPLWCQEFILGWQADNNQHTLTSTSMYEYRWCKIYVHPFFLERSPEEREEDMVHECLHMLLEPMQSHENLLKDHLQTDATKDTFEKMGRRAREMVVCDLTRVIRGPMPSSKAE